MSVLYMHQLWSACQCHISTNFGRLQAVYRSRYPKTMIVNNLVLMNLTVHKILACSQYKCSKVVHSVTMPILALQLNGKWRCYLSKITADM